MMSARGLAIVAPILCGVVGAVLVVRTAFDHNPQIDWAGALALGGVWFVSISLVVAFGMLWLRAARFVTRQMLKKWTGP